jgi:hypothetical protein
VKYLSFSIIILIFSTFFLSCANQQPPGGGEEDRVPPEIISTYPKKNTVNFRENTITLEFSEYVERRSFIDALRISPQVRGGFELNWSGTTVDIVFENEPFKTDPDKTFLITVNSNLKDIHGNSIASPFTLAFSTGSEIDNSSISGKVFNNQGRKIIMLAYDITESENNYDPVNRSADYYTETDEAGNYILTNLAERKYRIIAIDDDDKNLFYTAERENYSVSDKDITLTDTIPVTGINFYLNEVNINNQEINLSRFTPDSLGFIHSSVAPATNILPEGSIFFYFRNYKPNRFEFAQQIVISDEQNNRVRPVINWKNDSIVEIFAAENFTPARTYTISFPVELGSDADYNYSFKFKTHTANAYGKVSGVIRYPAGLTNFPDAIIELRSIAADNKSETSYSITVKDSLFRFEKVLQGDYDLFAFLDVNADGKFTFGSPSPFSFSEPFYIYPSTIKVKAGWEIDNVVVDFNK